jgi:serine/threonine protein kinase
MDAYDLDLPDYCDFVTISNEPSTGLSIQTAHVKNHPEKRVRIKACTFYSEEENQLLKNESEVLKHLNKARKEFFRNLQKAPPARRSITEPYQKTRGRKKSIMDVENSMPDPVQRVRRGSIGKKRKSLTETNLMGRRNSVGRESSDVTAPYFTRGRGGSLGRRDSTIQAIPMMMLEQTKEDVEEYIPLKTLIADFIPNYISLERMYDEGCFALIVDDFQGLPLRSFIPNLNLENANLSRVGNMINDDQKIFSEITLGQKLDILLQLADVLNYIHTAKIGHLEISPDNILLKNGNGNRYLIQLINFTNSTSFDRLPLKTSKCFSNLAYTSPELTGRTESTVDYRSDMYSVGITMWELLTEEQAFRCKEDAVNCF